MCLVLFAYKVHPSYRLVMAANRDEFYARRTAPLAFWNERPDVLAGRDLEQQGTWMGITRSGRFAAITNYRDPLAIKPGAPSRGGLVADFLLGDAPPKAYLSRIAAVADQYNGFNLLVGDPFDLYYFANSRKEAVALTPGVYGLSNHLLDTPWPKVILGKTRLHSCLNHTGEIRLEGIFDLLQDQTVAGDDQLPRTGLDPEWERILSAIFITSPGYGTRSSSVLLIDKTGGMRFSERTWKQDQPKPIEQFTRSFELPPKRL